MTLPTPDIITAALTRYRADTTLRGLLVGSTTPLWSIFDEMGVPTNRAFPYVTVFPIMSSSGTGLVMGTDGVDTWLQLAVYTQTGASGGFAQARLIMKRLYSLTQVQPFDLSGSGLNNFFCLFENEQENKQEDGITQQIVHRYHCMVQG